MDEEVKNLMKKNLEANEESLKILRKIYKDIWWRRLFGFAKLAIVIGLLIFSYLQLEHLINNLLNIYQKLLNPTGGQNVNLNVGVSPNIIPSELKNLLNNFLNPR